MFRKVSLFFLTTCMNERNDGIVINKLTDELRNERRRNHELVSQLKSDSK